jgi:oligopeptidase A
LDRTEDNPLLDFSGLPRFAAIRPEHVAPAIDELLARARAARDRTNAAPPTWDEFVAPLEDANERLGRAWGQVGHLHAVMDSPPLREVYNANQPKVVQYWTELGQDTRRFGKYKALAASPEYARLSPARRKLVEDRLRDFRLGGAELSAQDKPRFAAIQDELAALSTKFAESVLDATNAFSILVDESRTAGIPAEVLAAAREAAQKDGKAGFKFTLRMPSYFPVMQYAEDRALRETLYRASATRASEFGKPEWDNTPRIARILELRREDARMLGYGSFAEVSLVPKMAQTPAQVLEFLRDLARRARPFAERDLEELKEFSRKELKIDMLQSWDLAYASEKLRAARYAFSDHEVKQYFPEPQVIAGIFRVVEDLFRVRITEARAEAWHEDVRFYEVRGIAGEHAGDEPVGRFYVDLYARESKQGGAWMDGAISRRRVSGGVQLPVAYLNCNFSRPVGGKPALFTHDEVITLFHEFGHGLHHLLTRAEDLGVSGIDGVEWDAVELPSQFMENFCWEWRVLERMTRHADTGAPLPRALFDKMRAAKNFQSGLDMLRQIEFALFDMRLHAEFDPAGAGTPLALLDEVRREVAVLHPPAWTRTPNSFSHIFAGGYAAGYYSYKWAEVLSADAFSAFEEARDAKKHSGSVLDPETGARFRDEILAVGGSRPAAESFRAFRGREPRVDALLRHSGMIPA